MHHARMRIILNKIWYAKCVFPAQGGPCHQGAELETFSSKTLPMYIKLKGGATYESKCLWYFRRHI
jgi:hypothetical protein